jgi:hypothetical protein
MEAGAEIPRDMARAQQRSGPQPNKLPRRARTRQGKVRLLQRSQLDGRTAAAQAFDQLVADIENDLGGRDQLTAIEKSLVEGFAGATIILQSLNAQMALGQAIETADVGLAISAMVRVASRLGEQRRARDVTVRSTQTSSVRAGLAVVDGEVHENQSQD